MSADTASGFCFGPPGEDGEWSGDDREPETMGDWAEGLTHFRTNPIRCDKCDGKGKVVHSYQTGNAWDCDRCKGSGHMNSPDIVFLVHCACAAAQVAHDQTCHADSGGPCTDCSTLQVIGGAQEWADCPCADHTETPARFWAASGLPNFANDLSQAFTYGPMGVSRAGQDDQIRRLLDAIVNAMREIDPADVYNTIQAALVPKLLGRPQ